MSDWIGLAFIVLLVAGAVVGLSFLGRGAKPMTNEEYERRVAEAKGVARGMAASGLAGLDKFVNPRAAHAVEIQRDFKAGYYNDQEKKGEGGDGEEAPGPDDVGTEAGGRRGD
jgi:hypothetical protein